MGAISASITSSKYPNELITRATTAMIATTAATIKKIGFTKIVAPNFTNAFDSVPMVLVIPVIALAISALLIVPNALANTRDLAAASSKSKLANESAMPDIPFLTCSNLEPDAKTFTASLASLILSVNTPAF